MIKVKDNLFTPDAAIVQSVEYRVTNRHCASFSPGVVLDYHRMLSHHNSSLIITVFIDM